jgi:hypothetical protein
MSNWILQAARKQSGKQITLTLAALGIVATLFIAHSEHRPCAATQSRDCEIQSAEGRACRIFGRYACGLMNRKA